MKIANSVRLKMLPLTEKESKSFYKQKLCCICKHKFKSDIMSITMTVIPENIGVLHISHTI